MGNPSQVIDESPVVDPDAAASSEVDAAVEAAVAKFAAEHGIEPPAAAAPEESALQALQELEHTSFAERLQALAEKGIEEGQLVSETPIVRALAAVVGEIVDKVG